MKKHFGWPDSQPEWYAPGALVPTQREFPVQASDDPHLRNALDLFGYAVWSTNVRVGVLSDFILELNSWHIKYLSVKVGDWVYREDRFVSTLSVQGISWGMHRVTLKTQFLHFSEEAARSKGIEPQQHQLLLAVKGLPQGTRYKTVCSL